jgi:PKD repeat protein
MSCIVKQSVQQTYVETQTAGAVTEAVNGNWLQAYCEFLGVTEPVNSSWLQALCNHFGITEPVYASWTIALANYYGVTSPVNGSWWYALACAVAPVVGNIPVSDFTSNFTVVDQGDTINFTDLSTVPNAGPVITDWLWTLPGATPSTSITQNPSVVYNTPGSYQVALEVANIDGSNTKTVPNYMTVNVVTQLIWNLASTEWQLETENWKTIAAPSSPVFNEDGTSIANPLPTFTGTSEASNQIEFTIDNSTYYTSADVSGVWSLTVTNPMTGAPGAGQNYAVSIIAVDQGVSSTITTGSINILETTTEIRVSVIDTYGDGWNNGWIEVQKENSPGVWASIEYNDNPFVYSSNAFTPGTESYYKTDIVQTTLSGIYGIRMERYDSQDPAGQGAPANGWKGPVDRYLDLYPGSYRIISGALGTYPVERRYTVYEGSNVLLPLYYGSNLNFVAGNVQQTFTI